MASAGRTFASAREVGLKEHGNGKGREREPAQAAPSGPHVILIPGTGGHGGIWRDTPAAFASRGFRVHTPDLRHHQLPLAAGAEKIATLSLLDYCADLTELARGLDSPPLLVGISLGGLLAQLVAARTEHLGVIAAAPAPAAGIFQAHPKTVRRFAGHFLQRSPWKKPLLPEWQSFRRYAAHTLPEDYARQLFTELVAESGRAYCEMAFPFLDRAHAARVDFAAVTGPVLVIGAEQDHVVPPRIARTTASRYANATYVELAGADHLLFYGQSLPKTMGHIDAWLAKHRLGVHTARD
jgi:pimeloyl-ACP methyl ester carboxylesterase